jgi:hypothetical protein
MSAAACSLLADSMSATICRAIRCVSLRSSSATRSSDSQPRTRVPFSRPLMSRSATDSGVCGGPKNRMVLPPGRCRVSHRLADHSRGFLAVFGLVQSDLEQANADVRPPNVNRVMHGRPEQRTRPRTGCRDPAIPLDCTDENRKPDDGEGSREAVPEPLPRAVLADSRVDDILGQPWARGWWGRRWVNYWRPHWRGRVGHGRPQPSLVDRNPPRGRDYSSCGVSGRVSRASARAPSSKAPPHPAGCSRFRGRLRGVAGCHASHPVGSVPATAAKSRGRPQCRPPHGHSGRAVARPVPASRATGRSESG